MMAGTEAETLRASEVSDRHYKNRDKAETLAYHDSLLGILKYIKRAMQIVYLWSFVYITYISLIYCTATVIVIFGWIC